MAAILRSKPARYLLAAVVISALACATQDGQLFPTVASYGQNVKVAELTAEEAELWAALQQGIDGAEKAPPWKLDDRLRAAAADALNYLAREHASEPAPELLDYLYQRYGIYEAARVSHFEAKPFFVRYLASATITEITRKLKSLQVNRVGVAVLPDGPYNMRYFMVLGVRRVIAVSNVPLTFAGSQVNLTGSFEIPATATKAFYRFDNQPPEKIHLTGDSQSNTWACTIPIPAGAGELLVEIPVRQPGLYPRVEGRLVIAQKPPAEFKAEEQAKESATTGEPAYPEKRAEQLEWLVDKINGQRVKNNRGPLVHDDSPEIKPCLKSTVETSVDLFRGKHAAALSSCPKEVFLAAEVSEASDPKALLETWLKSPWLGYKLAHWRQAEKIALGVRHFSVQPDADDKDLRTKGAWVVAVAIRRQPKTPAAPPAAAKPAEMPGTGTALSVPLAETPSSPGGQHTH